MKTLAFGAWIAFVVGSCGPTRPDAPIGNDADTGTRSRVRVSVDAVPGGIYHVIYQEDDGPWQRAAVDGDGEFSFLAAGRFGAGVTCADRFSQEGRFRFATVTETTAVRFAIECGRDVPNTYFVSGTMRGLSGHGATTMLGDVDYTDHLDATMMRYSDLVPAGTRSLLFGSLGADEHVDQLAMRRNVSISQDRVEDIDFAVDSRATLSIPITVAPGLPSQVSAWTLFRVAGARAINLSGRPVALVAPAPDQWAANDQLTVCLYTSSVAREFRRIKRRFDAPGDLPASITVAFPDQLTGGGISDIATGSHPRLEVRWQRHERATTHVFSVWSGLAADAQCDHGCAPRFEWDLSEGWLGSSTDQVFAAPDPEELDALGAWDHRLDLRSPDGYDWNLEGMFVEDGWTYVAGYGVGSLSGYIHRESCEVSDDASPPVE